MTYYGNGVIDVNVKGSAETTFTSATFKASVTKQGPTGPAAKELAIPVMESIKKAILSHADKAAIDTTRLKTTFAVDVARDRHSGQPIGYEAVYTITFTGKNVVAAPAVHDALTSIEGVQAPTPIYNVNDDSTVHALAFADAVNKAKSKFRDQCEALGMNAEDFVVLSWNIRDEEPRGKMLSFTEGATAKPVGLEPGKASLDMQVTFAFCRKVPAVKTPS
jgi:uncharacterized protein YggE